MHSEENRKFIMPLHGLQYLQWKKRIQVFDNCRLLGVFPGVSQSSELDLNFSDIRHLSLLPQRRNKWNSKILILFLKPHDLVVDRSPNSEYLSIPILCIELFCLGTQR